MSQAIEQESNESEYSFEAIVAVHVLEEYLDRISAIFGEGGECKIHLGDDGIWTRAVEPANVGMVDLSLDYLQPTGRVFDGGDELTMVLGEEFPTKIEFEFADGDGEGTYMIAPRIQKQ
jgi:DNA polymerase III sliding clamp (beta) subunit (PCNA family)